MPTVRVRCGCGHSWDLAGRPPADLRGVCPGCQPAATHPQPVPPPPADGPFQPGDRCGGFEIVGELSRGGMGAIYQARQLGLNRLVALKAILPGKAGTPAAVHRFEREVRAAARVSHPNIVTAFATDLGGPVPYLVMEYVPGIDLHRLVRQAGPLPVADAVRYARQAADGLQHCFEHGLVHRDIKPANLMVTPDPLAPPPGPARRPVVKILDLGLARAVDDAGDLTRAGEFLGTPDYVSPEQAQCAAAADTRADLFSLGGTLYFLLTGDPPLPPGNLLEKLSHLLTEPPPRVRDKRPDVPAELEAVVCRLLARAPAGRFQTPAELTDALDALLASGRLGTRPGVPAATQGAWAAATAAPGSTTVGPAMAPAHPGGVRTVAAAADRTTLLTAGPDGTLRVWDPLRLVELRRVTGDVGAVTAAAVAPAGGWAVSAATRLLRADVAVQVWDLRTLHETARLRGPADNPLCVAVSADGRRVAAGTADREVWVWPGGQSGGPGVRFGGHAAPVAAVLFLPGGDALLSADEGGQVRQWDLRTGGGRGAVALGVGRLCGLSFSGLRGKEVAACGTAGAVVRTRDGAVRPLGGHAGAVRGLAFSPGGSRLATAGADGTVRVWRAADGRVLAVYSGFAGAAACVGWSGCGGGVFAGGTDGTLRRWPAPAA